MVIKLGANRTGHRHFLSCDTSTVPFHFLLTDLADPADREGSVPFRRWDVLALTSPVADQREERVARPRRKIMLKGIFSGIVLLPLSFHVLVVYRVSERGFGEEGQNSGVVEAGVAWRGGEGARSSLTSQGVVRRPVLDHERDFRPALVGDEDFFVSRFEGEFFFDLAQVDAVPAVQERGRGLLDLRRGAGNDLQRIRVGLDLVEAEFFFELRLDGDGRHHRREAEGRKNYGLVGALHGCSSVLDRRGGTCLCSPFPFVFLDLPHICPNPAIRSEPLLGDFYSLRNPKFQLQITVR